MKELAAALSRVKQAIKGGGVLRSEDISRADREMLTRLGWLQEVIQGWYLLTKPEGRPGDSSLWYANFWEFLRLYLTHYFGEEYCLSAENSLDLLTGATVIPKQIVVMAKKGGGAPRELLFNTSIFVYSVTEALPEERILVQGLQLMTLPYALCKVSPAFFQKNRAEAQIALGLVRSSDELSVPLLQHNLKTAAARLVGGYEHLGNQAMASELKEDLERAGWKVAEQNPFEGSKVAPFQKFTSPYAGRIFTLWQEFREQIIPHFPGSKTSLSKQEYFDHLTDIYEQDAYNSLSIEGYHVDEELIAKVEQQIWNPDINPAHQQDRDTLAARGYYETFLEVKNSLSKVLDGDNAGSILETDLKKWYQSLFSPLVRVGLLHASDLVGFRRSQVYIRNSRHVPLPKEALMDAMGALFTCLKTEPHSAVRAVLGHYFFVYIHPYMDGNGRLGRFLMNLCFASGNYPWTIIRMKNRSRYFEALETATCTGDIEPFAKFIRDEMY